MKPILFVFTAPPKVTGKAVVVTGASRGLGARSSSPVIGLTYCEAGAADIVVPQGWIYLEAPEPLQDQRPSPSRYAACSSLSSSS